MVKMTSIQFMLARDFILEHARPLEKALFMYHFNHGPKESVYTALKAYQNKDGGFGRGLEPDFLLPDSSVVATSIAFQILSQLDTPVEHELVVRGIEYLLRTVDIKNHLWLSRPKEVNDYPHTPWWHFVPSDESSYIEANFVNPTPEIIGYLWEYQSLVPKNLLEELTEVALRRLIENFERIEMHGVQCYQRLGTRLPQEEKLVVQNAIKKYLDEHLSKDKLEWNTYVATPLTFVESKESLSYALMDPLLVEQNIDFIIDSVSIFGVWNPTWPKSAYELSHWVKAEPVWQSIITLNYLKLLKKFNRLI